MKEKSSFKILLITGEISGDIYGHLLIKTIKEINPIFKFFAIGGPRIRSLGIEVLFPAESLALVGIPSISDLKKYWFVYKRLKGFLEKRLVDAVILVDFPGFNLKIAKLAKNLGYPVIYFIAPQVWAWHKRRIKTLKKYVDRLYVVLPFEKDFFSSYGIPTFYLGHPILDIIKIELSKEDFYKTYNLKPQSPLVSFFPGSREKEVIRHLPMFLEVFKKIKKKEPEVQGIMVKSLGLKNSFLWEKAKNEIKVVENTQYDVLSYSTIAVLASGTITLEAGIIGTPAVVTYSLPSWMFFLAKILIKVPYVSLTNLILNKEVYPEVLQGKNKVEIVSNKVLELIKNPEKLENLKQELNNLKDILGGPGASWRIAEDMIKYLISLNC